MQKGEKHRRMLHNQIQELRGNVRVFARVRPFLPSDKTEPAGGALAACIDVNANDDSMAIRKVSKFTPHHHHKHNAGPYPYPTIQHSSPTERPRRLHGHPEAEHQPRRTHDHAIRVIYP